MWGIGVNHAGSTPAAGAKTSKELKTSKIMKKVLTETDFTILDYNDEDGMKERKKENGDKIVYKNRASAVAYCKKHKCIYVERKLIFYR